MVQYYKVKTINKDGDTVVYNYTKPEVNTSYQKKKECGKVICDVCGCEVYGFYLQDHKTKKICKPGRSEKRTVIKNVE
jgi:formylmethanofuran dehydrogenase subunit E